MRVDPGWWGEPGAAGADEHFPIALVYLVVVMAAEQDSVVLVGPPAPVPRDHMMCLTPGVGSLAARPGTSSVPQFAGGTGRSGEQPLRSAEVDQVPVGVLEGGDDLGIAAQVGGQGGGDLVAVGQPCGTGPVLQADEGDGDDQSGFDPARAGQVPALELAAA